MKHRLLFNYGNTNKVTFVFEFIDLYRKTIRLKSKRLFCKCLSILFVCTCSLVDILSRKDLC